MTTTNTTNTTNTEKSNIKHNFELLRQDFPHKLHSSVENPFDKELRCCYDSICEFCYDNDFTPNHITTMSLICGVVCCYTLYKQIKYAPAIFYFLFYFFDCVDGYYARKYDMVTEFGDYYDHVKDMSINLTIIYILYLQRRYEGILLFVLLLLLSMVHLGCQENLFSYSNPDFEHSATLSSCKMLCPLEIDGIHDGIMISKYIGTGTLTFFIILYFATLKYPT